MDRQCVCGFGFKIPSNVVERVCKHLEIDSLTEILPENKGFMLYDYGDFTEAAEESYPGCLLLIDDKYVQSAIIDAKNSNAIDIVVNAVSWMQRNGMTPVSKIASMQREEFIF